MPSADPGADPVSTVLPPLVNAGSLSDLKAPQVAPPVAAPEVAPAARKPASVAGLRAVPGDGSAAIDDLGALQAGALAALASSVLLLLLRLRVARAARARAATARTARGGAHRR